jgi:penicillin-binding protein A
VNRSIIRLYVLVIGLFALLIGFTSRWTIFEAAALRNNHLNRRALLQQERIPRGRILAADGTVLAVSVRTAGGVYVRQYPQHGLFAHAVGYSYVNPGQSGLEKTRNAALTGADQTSINSILGQLQGRRAQGEDVYTTLNVRAQRVALAALAGRRGAVVALDPRTGAVEVMAANPHYDPNALATTAGYDALNRDLAAPLYDRSTQSNYPPGSTFKVVSAIAAIDSGAYTPSSMVNGDSPKTISGVPLSNDNNQSFGDISLTTALTFSVNTVWAQVAVKLGKATLATYMNRLGFDRKPELDLPSYEMQASGEYYRGRIVAPTDPVVDLGRMGIGQDKLSVTPLQMALVAAAVANGGRLMAPHLTDHVIDRDGRTVEQIAPHVQAQVMSPSTAAAVTGMMANVVKEGTGTAAALSGIQVAGKTGTATTNQPGLDDLWFIAFAPVHNPRVAIAVTVEHQPGFGGTVAAPIAKQVMEALLR